MGTPALAKTNSEAPREVALAIYDDRQQAVLRSAIELWADASTGVESRRRNEVLKNKQKMAATQDALDHANLNTTTVYVQRIAVKRDLHSAVMARRRKGYSRRLNRKTLSVTPDTRLDSGECCCECLRVGIFD